MASSLSLSLSDLQYHVLLDVLGVLSDVIFFCGVFVGIQWIVGLWSDYSWEIFESSLNSFMHDCYSFVFLSDLTVWFGQLDWFILQWERCFVSSILRCSIPVTKGDMIRICIVAIKDKKMGFLPYWLDLSLYTMSSCLRRYSVLVNLIH